MDNTKQAKDWLITMENHYPNFKKCTILTFDDSKQGRKYLVGEHCQKNIDWDKIVDLNQKWAWVFFTVNSMKDGHTDKAWVEWVNVWICEIDWMAKESQKQLIDIAPIKPSMIIESKSSLHMYWFAKDGKIENRSKICRWLRNFFDWDKAIAWDISRVLRLPGFYHMKNPDEPFLCTVIDCTLEEYTEEQMLAAYPDTETYQEKQQKARKRENAFKDEGWDDFRDRVRAMDTKTVLKKVSWTSMVSYETIDFKMNANWTEQIIVNGKSTWCWLDKNWKIGSTDQWWPNRTNRVFWYWRVDWKELYQWIIKEFPMMKPDKELKPKKKEKAIVKEETSDLDLGHIVPFTRWIKELDNKFWKIDYHNLVVALWESWSGKTEFTFFQARQNANAWIKTCYIALEMTKWKMIDRIAMKRAGISKEQRDLKNFSDAQLIRMRKIHDEIRWRKNLEISSLENPTSEIICDFIREKNKEWYELFFLDNLGFIIWGPKDTELDVTKNASRMFKTLTNELNISLILLHHFNKWTSQSRQKLRELSDIRSSGKIENDADLIFQIRRDFSEEDERYSSKVLFSLQKDRNRWTPWTMDIKFVAWDYEVREDPF